ncbi:MAG: DNA-3-methyladenine glycosylase I [Gemmataceae bacterium]|nr:DNA-3-methyladenine glycosylase I [Gemmataceae bacterium]
MARCRWAGDDPLMRAYHDEEWGVPCHDDRQLFERLMLEANQAGLSWSTILKKRESFRRAYDDWEPARLAAYGEKDIARILADPGVIRNRLKVAAAVKNARSLLDVQRERGSFDAYVWSFVDNQTLRRPDLTPRTIPSRTDESDRLSKDLQQRGFTFVGSTIVYAFMQSVGMADDHLPECFRYAGELPAERGHCQPTSAPPAAHCPPPPR